MTSAGNPKPGAPREDFGQRLNQEIDQAARKLEQESERVITYLNDEVVPAIRSHSSKALRIASEKLARLAEFMEQNRSR